jgi:hypothetical protein
LVPAVEALIEKDTAGSPVDADILWTNRSATELAEELREQGFDIAPDALRRILFEELSLSRRQAYKDESARNYPHRDEQFQYIAKLRAKYEKHGWPVLSIDTKKKEILGNFFQRGQAITNGRLKVQDHDFVTAEDRLVPYGVFDTVRNEALMYLACGADTSELACDAIWRWWQRMGRRHYRHVPRLLLLGDCGGSNGNRHLRFKQDLCELAADMEVDLQVAHYPPGCSKYNPIEHRLFCHVSRAIQAVILKTIEIARDFMARTTTALGLRVVAETANHIYEKGRKATLDFLEIEPIEYDRFLPELNYTAPWISLL